VKNNKKAFLDILGISSATLYMIHSLVFPMITSIPFELRQDSRIDLGFALVGLWAVIKIIRNANLLVIFILLNSMTLILFSVFIEIYLDIHTDYNFLGGTGMIIGHFINYKFHLKNNQE
jgi:hypothetical protein